MTKEKIDTVLERLDSLGLGVDNGDGVDKQQPTPSNALLASVISSPLPLTPRRVFYSALKRIEDKLPSVSERVGDAGSDKDTKVVSELMDYIRDAVGRQTVSGKAQTGSGI